MKLRKIASVIAAAALMMGVSTSAFAAFGDLELIRVTYGATTEVAADLGNVANLLAHGGTNLGSAGFSAGTGTLYTTYYAVDQSNFNTYMAINSTAAHVTNYDVSNVFSANGNLGVVSTTYANASNTSYASISRSNIQSFYSTFEGGTPGNGGFAGSTNLGTDLTLTGAAQTQGLYFFNMDALFSGTATSVDFAKVADIITNADGSTTIAAPAASTPIPAAIYLMGSGLLGLVGIRRKQK